MITTFSVHLSCLPKTLIVRIQIQSKISSRMNKKHRITLMVYKLISIMNPNFKTIQQIQNLFHNMVIIFIETEVSGSLSHLCDK